MTTYDGKKYVQQKIFVYAYYSLTTIINTFQTGAILISFVKYSSQQYDDLTRIFHVKLFRSSSLTNQQVEST